ncbi:dethiobiotin synthase [Coralloluteibacterium thermophilus]|uniref:ATP-dependent dethiobiotin synthetase BioD n=1 Tax=Coralloluteibacterium thermophilum TaxID=2707049 RepID=A0ABV9NEB1_9GAMM
MSRSVFVTGTDTEIGKTVASCALLHALRDRGCRAVGMKPVASGSALHADGGWRNEDALALLEASDPRPDYELVNPYALPVPTAPELAARQAGVELRLEPMLAAYTALRARADIVVVEGVGGWQAPLTEALDQAEVARAMALPVVLVVGVRLGCVNHARLSARAILDQGFALRGWVANHVQPGMLYAAETVQILHRVLPAPCLGVLPYMPDPQPQLLAAHLDVSRLVEA